MRPDMAKVVTERPRRGHANKSLKTGGRIGKDHHDDDDHGASVHPVSAHRQHGWNAKEFSDLLGPLRGYLKKQVGRPWNKIYSELSKTLDKRSLAGLHIWGHITSEVEITPRNWRYYRSSDFFVNAAGILCYKPYKRPRYRKREDPNLKKLPDGTELQRFDGIWYEVLAKVPVLNYQTRTGTWVKDFSIAKRQLNRRELRQHELENMT